MNIKTYSELIRIPTFIERYRYLRMGGRVGAETFGFDRYLNQRFYKSDRWLEARDYAVIRDDGCDLAMEDRKISGNTKILVHHINPITIEDVINDSDILYDPENLITTIKNTHDAIHYGDESLLLTNPIERRPFDTCPWRRN